MDQINVDQVDLGDNEFIRLGNSQDLTMVHTSTQSIINQAGIGDLLIQKAGSTKLTINATGIDVTGTVTADGLTVDTDTLVVDATNNRVGIGTSSPSSARLQVKGAGTTVSTNAIFAENSAGAGLFAIRDNGEAFLLGNVGIGTSSPTYDLDILNTSETILGIRASDSSGTNVAIRFQDAGTGTGINGLYVGRTSALNYFWTYEAEPLLFGTSATERMRIDASGNVGIGTSSPAKLIEAVATGAGSDITALQVRNNSASTSTSTSIRFVNSTVNTSTAGGAEVSAIRNASDGGALTFKTAANTTATLTERMRIDASGNLGIGTDSPLSRLVASASNGGKGIELQPSTGSLQYIISYDRSAADYIDMQITAKNLIFGTNTGAEAMRLDSSGNLLVGTSDSSPYTTIEGFVVALNNGSKSAACFGADNVASRTVVNIVNPNGSVGSITTNASATSYNTSSDQRLKESILDAPSASNDIDAIQVRSFVWKADGSHQKYGMVAQELQSVAPEAVSAPEDPEEMMGVDYSKLVPMMLKEIQSLRARVAQLES